MSKGKLAVPRHRRYHQAPARPDRTGNIIHVFQGLAQGADEPWRSIGAHLGFSTQLAPLLRGLVDLKSLVFFASAILFMLLLTDRAVEAQRWT